jgi:hypothetical protein
MATYLGIVSEIRRQLYAGGTVKVMSWGAHAWAALDEYTLRFRVTGRLFRGAVTVHLTGMDDYTVQLLKMNGTVVKTITGVYCDNLTEVIDNAVEKIPAYKS